MSVRAICKFSTCKASFLIQMAERPTTQQKYIKLSVHHSGLVRHLKSETRCRPASNVKQGHIAKTVRKGNSRVYYSRLSSTPLPEVIAGKVSRSLSKNILKVISSELKKSKQLHDNVVLELTLTQDIIRECDSNRVNMPGYIQVL